MIKLPFQYNPRSYQRKVWELTFHKDIKHMLLLWHRRAGKDKTGINIMVAKAFQEVGAYYYLFPELKQAKRDIWEGRGKDGIAFLDHFPPEFIFRVNHTEMIIEFVNGSIFRLCGADRYKVLRGSNPLGIIYSEYAEQNPEARQTLLPIITENNGWEIFIYTPQGQNHVYDLYLKAQNNPDWYCEKLTIDDTKRPNGEPVITKKK